MCPAIVGASRASRGSSRTCAGALGLRYRWEIEKDPQKELEARLAQLEAQVKALQPEVDKVAVIAAAAAKLGATSVALGKGVMAVDPEALRTR